MKKVMQLFTILMLAVLFIGTAVSAGTPIIIGSDPVNRVIDDVKVIDDVNIDNVNSGFHIDSNVQVNPDIIVGDEDAGDADDGDDFQVFDGNTIRDDLQVSGSRPFERADNGLIVVGGINNDWQVYEPAGNGYSFNGNLGQLDQGLDAQSNELHIDSAEVVGEAVAGQSFTVRVTATDGDDLVTRVGLGTEPYATADYDIRECNPADHTCTEEFSLMETTAGIYVYELKAKNDQDQIVIDEITVTVVNNPETTQFNFRTAAMDGSEYDDGNIEYVDSQITIWGDAIAQETFNGLPFINVQLPSNARIGVIYSADGYTEDEDYFVLDSRLPSCTGEGCEFTQSIEGDSYTTSCELEGQDDHYFCTLTTGDDYYITFDFRAQGDELGPNTIRRYNLIYEQASPIVEFQDLKIDFVEGGSASIDLDDYVHDADTNSAQLDWTVTNNQYVDVQIDPVTHEAVFTQKDANWLGGDIMRFIATDPQGNSDSDWMTVTVSQSDNDAPVITYKFPDSDTVNVGQESSLRFSIDAMDPDYDPLTVEWYKEGTLAAQDVFNYLYTDDDGQSHTVEVIVSDGQESVSESWTTNIVEPIGTVEGTVTDLDTALALEDVHVEILDNGELVAEDITDNTGFYSMTVHDGTYTLRFTKAGYYPGQLPVTILAGETTVQNAQLQEIPPQIGDVQGTVTDADTTLPVEGVTVEALVAGNPVDSALTNAVGFYEITGLAVGTYSLRFSKSGYETLDVPGVEIALGQTTTQDAQITPAPVLGTISGTVEDEQGSALSGALVRVLDGQNEVDSQLTNGLGQYSMDVPAGIYDVEVTKDGFKPQTSAGVSVNSATVTTLDFVMQAWWDSDWARCKDWELTESDGIPRTAMVVNQILTGLTFNNDYEIRILSQGCTGTGGSEVPYSIIDSGNDWIYISYYVDLSSHQTRTYSVYYDNPSASNPHPYNPAPILVKTDWGTEDMTSGVVGSAQKPAVWVNGTSLQVTLMSDGIEGMNADESGNVFWNAADNYKYIDSIGFDTLQWRTLEKHSSSWSGYYSVTDIGNFTGLSDNNLYNGYEWFTTVVPWTNEYKLTRFVGGSSTELYNQGPDYTGTDFLLQQLNWTGDYINTAVNVSDYSMSFNVGNTIARNIEGVSYSLRRQGIRAYWSILSTGNIYVNADDGLDANELAVGALSLEQEY